MKKMHLAQRILIISALILSLSGFKITAQLAKDSNKFFGAIQYKGIIPSNFGDYWNQVTPENSGKWSSCEQKQDDWNYWGWIDSAYEYAKENNLPFKEHTLVWGHSSGEPAWIKSLSPEQQLIETEDWIRKFAERYPDTDLADVVNEPLHAPPSTKQALGGNGKTGWDWVIWSYEQARKYLPNTKLLINDYGILNDPTAAKKYLELIKLLQNRALIDGIGCQGHGLEYTNAATIKANLDLLQTTGLPIYISEYEVRGDEQTQLKIYKEQIPVFWEHPAVAGVTLWGYIEGEMWRENAFLLTKDGKERAALQWLRSYLKNDIPIVDYSLNYQIFGNGSIIASPEAEKYKAGTKVTIKAIPAKDSKFDKWSGDISSTDSTITITIEANTTLSAHFYPIDPDTTQTKCNNPQDISLPINQNGSGEFCWVTSQPFAHVSSWNMEEVIINGIDYTNTWSNTLPESRDGKYYIQCKATFPWSHFEATALKGAPIANPKRTTEKVQVYPNPFNDNFNMEIKYPETVKNISIYNQYGKLMKTFPTNKIKTNMQMGRKLKSGTYFIITKSNSKVSTIKILKR